MVSGKRVVAPRGRRYSEVMLDFAAQYDAFRRRDPAWDGVVFVAVKTTGVYCRPVCPARTPLARNVSFYRSARSAERAGLPAVPALPPRGRTVLPGLEGHQDDGRARARADRARRARPRRCRCAGRATRRRGATFVTSVRRASRGPAAPACAAAARAAGKTADLRQRPADVGGGAAGRLFQRKADERRIHPDLRPASVDLPKQATGGGSRAMNPGGDHQ